MSQATQEPSESSPETTASQVAEELGVFFFELPGSVATSFAGPAVSAAGAITGGVIPKKKNLVILQEHRDLIVKLEYPQNSSFRLYSPEKRFYDPLRKEQTDERLFASGEDVHLWLSKFHQPKIQLQRKGEDGQWEDYSFIDPAGWDTEDYSALIARPAPIILKVGPPGSPIGTSMKPPKPGGTMAEDYKPKLADYLQSTLDPSASKSGFLRQWQTGKFPEVDVRSCHPAPDTQQEPDVSFVFEVTPDLTLFRYTSETEEEGTLSVNDGLTASDLADAVDKALKKLVAEVDKNSDAGLAVAEQVADKAQLIKDLHGTKVKITTKRLKNGSVKKFVVLSGKPGLRKFLTGTRYGVANAKLVTISASQMTMSELASAAGKNVRDLAKPGTWGGKFLIIALVMDTWQWLHEGGKEVEKLFASWTITLGVAVVATASEPLIALMLGVALTGVVSVGWIAVAVGVAVLFVGVGIGYVVAQTPLKDFLSRKYKELREHWESDLDHIFIPGLTRQEA